MWLKFFQNIQNSNEESECQRFLIKMQYLAAVGCLLICLYSLHFRASDQLFRILGVGLLVAAAALLSGCLLGFVFAIPRVPGKQKGDADASNDSVQHNGNLDEISDWLTKIIVGVGLVELHSISRKLGEISYDLAPGLQLSSGIGGAACADSRLSGQAAGLAIIFFYFSLGFLWGYIWTVIHFQNALQRQLEKQKQTIEKQKQENLFTTHIWKAEYFINANQLDTAMSVIDEALKNDPNSGLAVLTKARIFKRMALKSQPPSREKLEMAIHYAEQATKLMPKPDKGEGYYNIACYQAILDAKNLKMRVLENLELAFRYNRDLRQNAKSDTDLESLREEAEFKKLIDIT